MSRYSNIDEDQIYRMEARRRREMAVALDRLSVSSAVRLYSIDDFIGMSGWSRKTVQKLFNDPSFPSMDYGRTKLVEAHALIAFLSVKHERDLEPYWIKMAKRRKQINKEKQRG